MPVVSRTDAWDRARQAFADQFEQDGSGFVYRRSQKGEAIRVSAEEHDRFIGEFNSNLRRANWIIYVGLTLVLGGIIALSLLSGSDLSEAAIFIGIGAVMIPYVAYYRWAWAAPARELAGRTPIAVERSPEEARRLQFQRVSYGQLAGAAFAGLVIPFIGSSGDDVFSGWNRLWLVFGGALVLMAAVQAFRKWRSERDNSYSGLITPLARPDFAALTENSSSSASRQLWRFAPLAVILIGAAFIALTPAGKELARTPAFWPLVMIGLAVWSATTVVRGFSKGQIEPFARGFYNTYERETQPKRFWASMAWNSAVACLCIWIALTTAQQANLQSLQDRCDADSRPYSPRDALAACDDWIRLQPRNADAYFDRGLIFLDLGAFDAAAVDLTKAHNLDPKDPWALANLGLALAWKKQDTNAEAYFEAARAIDPSNPVMLRGQALLKKDAGDLRGAVDSLTASMKRDPDNLWALQLRSDLYWQLGEQQKSIDDDHRLLQLKKKAASN
jgi:tetratricopeptide (TPR) repeat protein